MSFKEMFIAAVGAIGAFISTAFGGWPWGLSVLCVFMAIDYITGLIVAAVFKRSPKTETGSLESHVAFKGVVRKIFMLVMVLIGAMLDRYIGCNYIRDAVIIAFLTNELISLTENAGLMGVPIPKKLKKAIEILKDKAGEDDSNVKGN